MSSKKGLLSLFRWLPLSRENGNNPAKCSSDSSVLLLQIEKKEKDVMNNTPPQLLPEPFDCASDGLTYHVINMYFYTEQTAESPCDCAL